MENKSHALAAGVFVLAVVALLAGLAIWLTRDMREYNVYELTTKDGVSGLQPQATVRYKGVPVGKVVRIGFDNQVPGNVLIRIAVGEDTPVTKGTFAMLGYQGVTGLAHIQLDDGVATEPPPRGSSGLPRLPMRSSPLNMLADQGPILLERIDEISKRLVTILGDENQKHVSLALGNIGAAAASIDAAAVSAQQLAGTLNKAAAQLPLLSKEAQGTLQSLGRAGNAATAVATDLQKTVAAVNAPDGPLHQIAQGADALGTAANALNRTTLPRFNRTADDVSRSMRQIGSTVSRFGENPQSLIYGSGPSGPGPGEPGFVAPTAAQP